VRHELPSLRELCPSDSSGSPVASLRGRDTDTELVDARSAVRTAVARCRRAPNTAKWTNCNTSQPLVNNKLRASAV